MQSVRKVLVEEHLWNYVIEHPTITPAGTYLHSFSLTLSLLPPGSFWDDINRSPVASHFLNIMLSTCKTYGQYTPAKKQNKKTVDEHLFGLSQGTSWTICQTHSWPFTPKPDLQSPINLTCKSLECGRKQQASASQSIQTGHWKLKISPENFGLFWRFRDLLPRCFSLVVHHNVHTNTHMSMQTQIVCRHLHNS